MSLSLAAGLQSQVVAYHDQNGAQHQAQFDILEPLGYRMISMTIYGTTANLLYGAVWVKRNGPKFVAFHGKTGSQYQTLVNTWVPQGYTGAILTATGSGSDERFAGVLELTNTSPYLKHGLTQTQFFNEMDAARGNGWRIKTADVYGTNSSPRFIVSYEKYPDLRQGYFVSVTNSGYQKHFDAFAEGHSRPALVAFNNNERFLSTWRHEDVGKWTAHHNMTSAQYQANFNLYNLQGLYPISMQASGSGASRRFAAVWAETDLPKSRSFSKSGLNVVGMTMFDIWIENWMKTNDARSASMAIVKDARLVFTRGYRYAESGYPMAQPDSLYRIASLTKPITSIAVHQHYEKLPALIDPSRKMVSYLNPSSVFDSRTNDITIDHLLTHRGGWDRKVSFDAMFRDETIATALTIALPISKYDVFNYMSTTISLDFKPGASSKYSNYGVSLAGQILEQLNLGMTYEQIIQRDVFNPLGMTRPSVSGSLKSDVRPGEVRYHPTSPYIRESVNSASQPWVAGQYGGWNQDNMDSHGAYVMAAPDLALICATFDLGAANPLLGLNETNNMFSAPVGFSSTLRGWFLRNVKDAANNNVEMYNHNGKLAGTSTLVLRRDDGISIVLFTNSDAGLSSSGEGQELSDLCNRVVRWPTHDLFRTVGLRPLRTYTTGTFSPYGTACAGSAGRPTATGTGVPETGQTFTVDVSSVPPSSANFALLGFNRAAFDLRLIGAPGCVVLNDAITALASPAGRSGTASVPMRVPSNPNLVGAHLLVQFVTFDTAASGGVTTSNGLDILIGGTR